MNSLTIDDLRTILVSLDHSLDRMWDYSYQDGEVRRDSMRPVEEVRDKARSMRDAMKESAKPSKPAPPCHSIKHFQTAPLKLRESDVIVVCGRCGRSFSTSAGSARRRLAGSKCGLLFCRKSCSAKYRHEKQSEVPA